MTDDHFQEGAGALGDAQLIEAREALARNVAAARTALQVSQDDLAAASAVSRATIIQIESGTSDPRLSTLVSLASALQVSPLFLLLGATELAAIGAVATGPELEKLRSSLSTDKLETMRRLLQSGITRNRNQAVKMAGSTAAAAGLLRGGIAAAAIGSIIAPGTGWFIGAALGSVFAKMTRANVKENVGENESR
jgi:transcriptional regulator with XRE-family HTH domain